MLTTERRLFPHNHWQRPALTFRDGVPAGFAEDANVSPVSPMGLLAFFPLLLVLLLLVIVFVVRPRVGRGALRAPTAAPQWPGDNGHPGRL